ncbi:PAS domain-containing sensor histidine kinase [Pedobacter sp. P351]|uniref:PAS domain-containing sensor histidine kinase n=1 Tax=Pedobacter superstes TaxID=3133441 RepID=UPI0030A14425
MAKESQPKDYKKKFTECDDRFQTLFKLTSVASKIIDSDLTIIKVNQALTELLGYSAEEIQGTKILDYACEQFKKHWHQLQDELWSHKKPFFKLDACLQRKDKSIVWVNITTILFNEDDITYGYTVLDDITGQKHLEESEKRLNLALQYSKMAVWEMNLIDHSVIRSESHDEIFGYKKPLNNWTRDHYIQHLISEDAEHFEKALNTLDHSTFDFKGRITTNDGGFKWIHLQGKPETNDKGENTRIVGTIKDITKEKFQERQKDDFIGIASHELKTPVTGLKASLQLLNKKINTPDEGIQKLIWLANKSMAKVSALIENLLSASSMDNGQLQLSKTLFIMAHLIDDCCAHIRLEGSYAIKTHGDLTLKVNADFDRIEQVLSNFVNNAVKYAPDSKQINIHIEKLNKMVKVSVTDNGPGIPAEKIPYLFDRFYRAENSGIRYSGLGIGLYISKDIISKHGGQIGAESVPGKGSIFWFTLPLNT